MKINKKEILLVKSPHLILKKDGKNTIAFNSLFGFPTVLNEPSVKLINLFSQPRTTREIEQEYKITALKKWIDFFFESRFLIPADLNEREEISQKVSKGIKKITSGKNLESLGLILDTKCNLDCSYCLAKKVNEASRGICEKNSRMLWPLAQKTIDGFLSLVTKNKVEIYFGGGEAFLNWELMKKIISYCVNKFGDRHQFSFSTNTNATLITPSRAKFLGKHKVIVTTSLDGPLETNDSVRYYHSGHGAYKDILTGWDNLTKFSKKVEWFCLTLTDGNINGIKEEFFDFLVQKNIKSCSFEPDLIVPLKTPPEELVAKLFQFKRWALERKITLGGMWDKPIKNMFEEEIEKRMFGCSALTGRGITVLPSGEIVPCSYSKIKIGTAEKIPDAIHSLEYLSLISSKAIG
jgi:sulfatase maturation enzyme AslB (radical SAM superfamily)